MTDELLQSGNWVRADSGEIGVVVHTTRQTAFLQVKGETTQRAFLLSKLTKINPPIREAEDP